MASKWINIRQNIVRRFLHLELNVTHTMNYFPAPADDEKFIT